VPHRDKQIEREREGKKKDRDGENSRGKVVRI
jgi:hypothetical protein